MEIKLLGTPSKERKYIVPPR